MIHYTKEMRERAKKDGKVLITIATPQVEYQTPATAEMVVSVHKFLNELITLSGSPVPPDPSED